MRKILVMTSLVAFAFAARPVLAAQKIGMVDMEMALQSVDAGKKAKNQLETEFNAKKKQLDAEKAEIDKMGTEFKKQSAVLSDAARSKKQAQLQERIMKFQEEAARSEQEIQHRQQDLTMPILNKLRSVIADIAKQKGYTAVLEKNDNTVLFSDASDDLTNDVITSYNKKASE